MQEEVLDAVVRGRDLPSLEAAQRKLMGLLGANPSSKTASKVPAAFLTELTRHALVRLEPLSSDAEQADVLCSIVALALDQLGSAKPSAKPAKGLETEKLQYNFVRTLVAKQRYEAAVRLGWKLFKALCATSKASSCGDTAVPRLLPPPAHPTKEAINLVVGAVLNLLMCTVEAKTGRGLEGELQLLLQPLADVDPWIG
jgi:hypothetical protein